MTLGIIHQSLWGSHAWGHDSPTSDRDVFTVYQTPTTEILRHPSNERGRSIRNNDVEHQRDQMLHEVGHVVAMLMNGPNTNYVWGIMSPAVEKSTREMESLQRILRDYPAKGIFHSAMGLADGNFKDILMRKKGWDSQKKRRFIVRSLRFAKRVIEDGVYDFRVVGKEDDWTLDEIGLEFAALKKAHDESPMRMKIPSDLLLDWLRDVRLKNLRDEGWSK